jgi:ATP-dependent exoDNAse (exonuclease V) beta subunit
MSSTRRKPLDQPVRDRLVSEFDKNFLVEAGAGSGKTYSLAMRMAAGIAAGTYSVEQMAAVTFTRKAAAELRGRFQLAVEERLAGKPSEPERQRLETALAGMERLFAGTIHAFCAHLLRERPVDARVAPGFEELSDIDNLQRQRQAWRDYLVEAQARGVQPMLDLLEAGIRPKDLYEPFAIVCEHEDVSFDMGSGKPPALAPVLKQVQRFWKELGELRPDEFSLDTTCDVQLGWDEFEGRLATVRRQRRLASLAALLRFSRKNKVTQKWWGREIGRDQSFGSRAKDLVEAFRAETIDPFFQQWWAYIHHLAMEVLMQAREFYRKTRVSQNVVNYVDLLIRTADMLRTRPSVRWALQQKYLWLFVDEFQDTDPIQAEIFLMLAADEPVPSAAAQGAPVVAQGPPVVAQGTPVVAQGPPVVAQGPAVVAQSTPVMAQDPPVVAQGPPVVAQGFSPVADPFVLPLRPGALFVVGDPKQSIFRFRRADIDIYNRVSQRIHETGGEILTLTANFRSLPGVCALANIVFPPLFAGWQPPHSPPFEPLNPVREESDGGAGPRVARITIPYGGRGAKPELEEAARIAAYIQAEVVAKRRQYGDFLVLTRLRPRLPVFADAFNQLEIPVEVSGAGLFCESAEVEALALLLGALADPLDSVALVGVLRGPLFGLSDPELFQFRQEGSRFELSAPLPEPADASEAAALDKRYGPVLAAMRRLREMWRTTRRMPLAAAAECILEGTGWLALAAATPAGAGVGHLLQAIDRVREVVEEGGGLADAADAVAEGEDEKSSESEALPLEPGRRNVVRLMNLHKAKGLEAPVVFLADAAHAFEFPVVLRVVREGPVPTGYLRVAREGMGPGSMVTLGQPIDWQTHEAEEKKYHGAERLRLLYVAGTRAKDLMVVCRSDNPRANEAWGDFDGYLARMPELKVPAAKPVAKKLEADLSAKARALAESGRAERHDRARLPSWAAATVTGEKARLAAAERARNTAQDAAAAAAVPDTPSHRVDAGFAWGTLIHGLLEHAIRHESATRDDLARLAQWLTVETPDLRPFIPEALDLVEAASKAPFWQDARAGAEVQVEVPFAVRLDPGTSAGAGAPGGVPAILRGIIDLAYRASDGWRILDYKTDQIDGDDQALLARYGPQLDQYRFAWERIAADKVGSSGLVALRTMRMVWSE